MTRPLPLPSPLRSCRDEPREVIRGENWVKHFLFYFCLWPWTGLVSAGTGDGLGKLGGCAVIA